MKLPEPQVESNWVSHKASVRNIWLIQVKKKKLYGAIERNLKP